MTTGVAHVYKQEFIPLAEALLNSPEPTIIFDDYRNKDLSINRRHEINPLREILIAAVGECLNHAEYKISANAAVILRRNMILCFRACDLNGIVSALSDQVNERRIQPAKEAALALAFFLSTRPNDRELPQWHGSDPMTSSTMENPDLDQHRFVNRAPVDSGYLHEVSPEIVESVVNNLISNLNRKEYKRSSDWVVAKACAKALGAIGYQRPALVSDAVPEIQELLGEQDDRQAWLVYALTSIGYSRPDLIADDLDNRLKEFSQAAGTDAGWQLYYATRVGHQKIGHAPIHLEIKGCDTESNLSQIVEKLFHFMLGRYPSASEEWIQAFVEIYLSRSEALVELLSDELDQILQDSPRAFDFPDNFMLLLKELAGVEATDLQPIIDRSEDFYQDHAESHYWYENALEFHRRIATEDEDLLPSDLGDTVKVFLESETRHSVQSYGQSFLQEINQWDDGLFSTPDGIQTVDILEELAESEDFDIASFVEEVDHDELDSE